MKTSYKYGLITGLTAGMFTICFFGIGNGLNKHFDWGIQPASIRGIGGLLTILIQGVGIYLGMRQVKFQQGSITYGQAFKTGFTMALITAVITAVFGFVYCKVINPGYADYMVSEAHKAMIAGNASPAEIKEGLVAARREFSTGAQVVMALVGQSVIGTAISLIIAPFIKTKELKTPLK